MLRSMTLILDIDEMLKTVRYGVYVGTGPY